MRIGYVLGLISMGICGTALAGAQNPADAPATAPGPAGNPAPAAGYPPPPPGYPPGYPQGYPPPGYPPPGYPPPGYPPPPPPPTERTANNSIYLELLGPGLLYSINYDRTFSDFSARVGFSYLALSAGSSSAGAEAHGSFITVPLTVSYLGIGSKKNIFEIGAGATILHVGAGVSTFAADSSKNASDSTTLVLGDLIFGYRLQPPDGGFMLRTGLSPVFGQGAFIPLPYLALGGTF